MRFRMLPAFCLAWLIALPAQTPPQTPPVPPPTAAPDVTALDRSDTAPVKREPYRQRVQHEGKVISLSLTEAIEMALKNNLDIRIEQTNVDAAVSQLFGSRGFYDPLVSFNSSKSYTGQLLNLSPTDLGLVGTYSSTAASRNFYFQPSIMENLFTGGEVDANLNTSRTWIAGSTTGTLNPTYGSTLTVNFNQPLLRGLFSGSSGVHQIKIAAFGTRLARESYRLRVIGVVQQVLTGYLELYFAIENYETKRSALELASTQLENTRLRVKSGVLAGSAETAARSEVTFRDQDWVSSEVAIVTSQNALRVLISSDRNSPVWKGAILPSALPDMTNFPMTLDQALETARAHRPEISQLLLQQQQNLENTKFAANQRLPQVNFTASLSSPGQSGIVVGGVTDGFAPSILGGASTAIGQAVEINSPGWTLGIQAQLPLRNRSLEASYQQSKIADKRLELQAKSTQLQVDTNVVSAWESLAIQKKSVEATRLAREAAEAQVEAITARFEANLSTNFEVLSYQRDLADARVRELRSTIDYREALNNLYVAVGLLLEENNVVLPKN